MVKEYINVGMETKKYQCTSQNVPHFLVNSPRAFALSIIIWMATSEMYPPAENGIQSVQKMMDISHPLCQDPGSNRGNLDSDTWTRALGGAQIWSTAATTTT